MQLYLDLDGVFADLNGFCNSMGISYAVAPAEAWKKLDKVPNLFSKLDPVPGAIQFYKDIRELGLEPIILTALPMLTNELVTAPKDKREWVHKYLDPKLQVITVDSWADKKTFAKASVLVDDSRRNILDWDYHGGIGIWHDTGYHYPSLRMLKEVYGLARKS